MYRHCLSNEDQPNKSEFTVIVTHVNNDLRGYLCSSQVDPNKIHSLEDFTDWNQNLEGGIPGTHSAWLAGQDNFDKAFVNG